MLFLAPLWLTLLVPWMALVAWAWRRTAQERATTAAFLWRRDVPEQTSRFTNRRRPPAWVLSALAALLTLVLALANPAVAARAARVAVIVDPSVALSAMREGRSLRDVLIDELATALKQSDISAELHISLAGGAAAEVDNLQAARALPFTARSTTLALDAAVTEAAQAANAVVVLSSQTLPPASDGVAVLAASDEANIGIVSAVALARPAPSLMVRLAGATLPRGATLLITCGEWSTRRSIALPARPQTVDVFVDLPPSPGEVIDVRLTDADDGLAIDDEAVLRQTRGWPTLVLDGEVPPAATRFAAAYARSRGGDRGETVRVVATPDDSSASPQLVNTSPTARASGELLVTDSPLVQDVDLAKPPIQSIAEPPAGDWTTVASIGGRPIVCVREKPARAVWIGFDLDPAELRSVVLLSNAVEWLSAAAALEWRGDSPDAIGSDWHVVKARDPELQGSPGLYLDGAGRHVAVNVPAIASGPVESCGDVVSLLRRVARDAHRPLQPWLAIFAAGLAMGAALLSRQRGQS